MQPAVGLRSALKPGGARNRGPAPPDPTKQQDRHTALGALLLRAELAPDPLERMLAVCRVMLLAATDLLRPGRGFGDTPVALLGQHHLSKRLLAAKHRGDAMQLYLQELCSHEPLGPTQHPKYTEPPVSGELAGPAACAAAPTPGPAAQLQLRVRPAAAVRQQQGGLLAQLGGGGKAGAGPEGAPPAWVECALEGGLTIVLPRHGETYRCTLPTLVLAAPLEQECPLDFAGTATAACASTGLSAALRFKPFTGGRLKGAVEAMLGEGRRQVVTIGGSWRGAVKAESEEEGSGVLFDAAQFSPAATPSVNLAEPGPRALTRLWAAILESLACLDAGAAAKEGKRAAELAAALPGRLRRSLLFEVESSGLKPKAQAGEEEAGAAAADGAHLAAGLLPPCVLKDRAEHGGATYQVHYRIQPV